MLWSSCIPVCVSSCNALEKQKKLEQPPGPALLSSSCPCSPGQLSNLSVSLTWHSSVYIHWSWLCHQSAHNVATTNVLPAVMWLLHHQSGAKSWWLPAVTWL